jgi:hypothetical protein
MLCCSPLQRKSPCSLVPAFGGTKGTNPKDPRFRDPSVDPRPRNRECVTVEKDVVASKLLVEIKFATHVHWYHS